MSDERAATAGDQGVPAPRGIRRRLARAVGVAVLAALVLALAAATAEVASGRYELHPVRSGAMLPSFSVGGLAVAERVPTSALALRDVIVFAAPGRAGREVARRVVSLRRTSTGLLVRTEGDARARPDRWTLHLAGGHVDVVRLTLPLLGYLVSWDTSGNGATATLLVAGAVVVLLAGGVLAVEWDGPGNPPGPVRPQPDNGEPDRTEQDSPQADNGEPDRTEQDSPQPDNGEPDRTEQDSPQPDNGEPDRPEPDSPQADRSQPDRSETDRPEPGRGEAPD